MKSLHILNGDAILQIFGQSGIDGKTFIWREILCEGPSSKDIGSEKFWQIREHFLKPFSQPSFDKHFEKMKAETTELERELSQYDEVTLWFEYDLFCQINLMGLFSWLYQKGVYLQTQISLVCLGDHPNYDRMVGLGEIKPEEYKDLYENRQTLSLQDITFADHIWELFTSGAHDQLVTASSNGRSKFFPYLKAALEKHQRRFPDITLGLTEIEFLMLKHISQSSQTRGQLVGQMLKNQEIYGFGDLQYFDYLEDLRSLITEKDGQLSLNEVGEKVLAGEQDFMKLRKKDVIYGGAVIADFRWNSVTGQLMMI